MIFMCFPTQQKLVNSQTPCYRTHATTMDGGKYHVLGNHCISASGCRLLSRVNYPIPTIASPSFCHGWVSSYTLAMVIVHGVVFVHFFFAKSGFGRDKRQRSSNLRNKKRSAHICLCSMGRRCCTNRLIISYRSQPTNMVCARTVSCTCHPRQKMHASTRNGTIDSLKGSPNIFWGVFLTHNCWSQRLRSSRPSG